MTEDWTVRVLSGLQVVAALGITTFWLTWFREEHDEDWLPPGYVEHERPFVVPDSILAVVLVASAGLNLAEVPLGRSLALVAAGMLAFLGILDAVYFAQQGMFAADRGGRGNLAVVGSVLLLSALLVARYA